MGSLCFAQPKDTGGTLAAAKTCLQPSELFAVQVSYCAGSVLLTKMLHFKRAKSTFAALCNVEKRQAVWYNKKHADNTRLDFRRASPQSIKNGFQHYE